MNVTQITHHDLDGYGASTVVGSYVPLNAIVHVPRYADVGPVVDAELKRLGKAVNAEALIVTDLGLEDGTIKFLHGFAALNRRREADARHRLVVLDHHVSSLDRLKALNVAASREEGTLRWFDLGDPNISILIDPSRCATRMAYEHRALYGTHEVEPETESRLAALVTAIDAVDLWQKAQLAFLHGLALDEMFWDNVSSLVPPGHPWHDRFVGALLIAVAGLIETGLSPAETEQSIASVRIEILDAFLADDPEDDRALTTRMRIARVLARSRELFRPLSDGTLLSFGLDAGTFQRVSDLIMETGGAKRVANVQRSGSISLRSSDESALAGARLFRGGGHADAAGGKLPSGSAFSIEDACSQVEPILNPPAADPSASPFAALRGWKGS